MKKNFRLNWVDLLILVLMVGLVAGTYMKFRVSKTTNVVEPQTPIKIGRASCRERVY